MELNRRSALMLAGAAAVSGLSQRSASAQVYPRNDKLTNPVLFWNAVGLDLVSLDHSIESAEARAPGPCASARALALAHAVIADAVCFAYRTRYKPQLHRGNPSYHIDKPELFVGGAAAGILAHIFNTSMHTYTIGLHSERFKKLLGDEGGKDWSAGVAFANSTYFLQHWAWDSMQQSLLPQFSAYIPRPRRHNIDPYNAGQGYYGSAWGSYRPLVLDGARQVAALAPEAPPPEGSPEYERDLAEIRVKGALISKADRRYAARTPLETKIGLFWAYDGARLLGTPPRLYNQILRQIAVYDQMNVVEMARLFALCNLAMADAGVVAWWAKYRYNIWRPVLGIQNHAHFPDPNWLPFGAPKTNPVRAAQGDAARMHETAQSLMGGGPAARRRRPPGAAPERKDSRPHYRDAAFTPNFPAYPSGHATFGGACFTMLKLLRRERPQTRHAPASISGEFVSDELNGVSLDHASGNARPFYPLPYKSIDDMITDNDLSRIYLGVHWRFDCNRGSASGANVARAIYDAAYRGDYVTSRRGS
jgi:membrane-associated phospholipid phosphatase